MCGLPGMGRLIARSPCETYLCFIWNSVCTSESATSHAIMQLELKRLV